MSCDLRLLGCPSVPSLSPLTLLTAPPATTVCGSSQHHCLWHVPRPLFAAFPPPWLRHLLPACVCGTCPGFFDASLPHCYRQPLSPVCAIFTALLAASTVPFCCMTAAPRSVAEEETGDCVNTLGSRWCESSSKRCKDNRPRRQARCCCTSRRQSFLCGRHHRCSPGRGRG